ncbi:uncharacterized protein LOC111883714 [Lactuca sativa]|uniref:uncharacterized protein LOC111883714 n=1 Tax=Lactuca sativa TaxID=4236 RepID=UPI000CD9B401|nr:uncharacterized protein LOC111883714 [Lactuca sativa]
MDIAIFQVVVIATVAAATAQISTNGANGLGGGTNKASQGRSQGYPRECSYKYFKNCKPKSFDGTVGVIALTRWFKKTESVFKIYACPEASKVKFAACTFSDRALTWWNGYVKSLTLPVANTMSWEDLKILILTEYCPGGEVQKLEQKLRNLTMKDSAITAYTARFSDLACQTPGTNTGGSWSPPGLHDSLSRTIKRKWQQKEILEQRKGQLSQESIKKQQTVAVHAATVPSAPAPVKEYVGTLPKCNQCKFHHTGACREMYCKNCNGKGHTARFYRAPAQQTT